jgi:hypothetical protein
MFIVAVHGDRVTLSTQRRDENVVFLVFVSFFENQHTLLFLKKEMEKK